MPPTPEQRTKLQQLFENGNKQSSVHSFDYANDMFTMCVLGDPGNVLYSQSYVTNLRKKFGERKKKGVFGMLSGSGASAFIKKAEMQKQWDQVIKLGLDIIKNDPWDATTLATIGNAVAALGHDDAAIIWLKFALEGDPNDVEVNRMAGRAFRLAQRFDEAAGCWLRVLKAKPQDNEAARAKRDIDVERTIHKGKYTKGASGDTSVVESGPRDDQDAMGRQLSYEDQIERRIKKNPTDIVNYLEYAQYCYQRAEFDKCIANYRKAVEISKNEPDMIERLLDAEKQKYQADLMRLKDEFEKTPSEEIREAFNVAKEAYAAKTMELARHRVTNHPSNTSNRYELAILLQQRGEFKEAIAEFQKARGDVLKKGDCLLALGQCFQQIKQYKLALTHYEEANSVIDGATETKKKVLYLAAKLALGLGDLDKADRYAHELAAADFSYKDVGGLLDKIAEKRDNPTAGE
ncbi:MAG: tetratricopeptide repeat protein [Thermoguttaceae bacterium]